MLNIPAVIPQWDFPPQVKSKTPGQKPMTKGSSFPLNVPPPLILPPSFAALVHLPLYLSPPCLFSPRIRISAVYHCPSSFLSPAPTNLFPPPSVSHFFPSPHPSKWILHKELTAWWDWSLMCHQIIVLFSKPLKTIPITLWCIKLQQQQQLYNFKIKVSNSLEYKRHSLFYIKSCTSSFWHRM